MDNDMDGQISAENINIDNMHPDALELMVPIFEDLDERGQIITFPEFVDKIEELYEHMTVGQRITLFKAI